MALPIFKEIERFIIEHGSSVILKEHVSFLQTKLNLLAEDIEKIQKENTSLIKANTDLHQKLIRYERSEKLKEYRGALFKFNPGEGYSETPCCPKCKTTLYSILPDRIPFSCSNCGHISNLLEENIKSFTKKGELQ
ncbi:MAG: hypothetical protein JRE64_23540 [Deltaproteobacteria bacterium]|nr:hypothetical protein [Deltaproteobacteria bacterium]